MSYIAIALLVIGVLMLVIGYRKNSRNMLAASALILLMAAGLGDFATGFKQGLTSTTAAQSEASVN